MFFASRSRCRRHACTPDPTCLFSGMLRSRVTTLSAGVQEVTKHRCVYVREAPASRGWFPAGSPILVTVVAFGPSCLGCVQKVSTVAEMGPLGVAMLASVLALDASRPERKVEWKVGWRAKYGESRVEFVESGVENGAWRVGSGVERSVESGVWRRRVE